jgi:hypothetical protein
MRVTRNRRAEAMVARAPGVTSKKHPQPAKKASLHGARLGGAMAEVGPHGEAAPDERRLEEEAGGLVSGSASGLQVGHRQRAERTLRSVSFRARSAAPDEETHFARPMALRDGSGDHGSARREQSEPHFPSRTVRARSLNISAQLSSLGKVAHRSSPCRFWMTNLEAPRAET